MSKKTTPISVSVLIGWLEKMGYNEDACDLKRMIQTHTDAQKNSRKSE